MPREGTKTNISGSTSNIEVGIEIRYAPGGDENNLLANPEIIEEKELRLDMPREGTKTFRR